MREKRILFVHQNYPGQFKHLAPFLVEQGCDVRALRQSKQGGSATQALEKLCGVEIWGWSAKRGTNLNAHPWAQDTETKFIRGEAAAEACEELKRNGWYPDLIVGHPGWGEMLFLKHIWPSTPQIHYLEFHYAANGLDVGFDPEFSDANWRSAARVTAKAGPSLLNLETMDAGLSPTHFQASTYPTWAQQKIQVVHDGINTDHVRPNPNIEIRLTEKGKVLRHGDPVITFVNRTLEPYRGYHRFIRALPEIQKRCPEAITIIVGSDGVSYGAAPKEEGATWKNIFLREVAEELDFSRIVFTGNLEYKQYLGVLQISACHVYLTYPFVLGWSCLEAMAAGCLVVGSATPPVEEVIQSDKNGMLVDFFDQDQLVATITDAITQPSQYGGIRAKARETIIKNYDLKRQCLPVQHQIIRSMLK